MALKTKVDYYGLSGYGWAPASTELSKTELVAQAQDSAGFLVVQEDYGTRYTPTVSYVALSGATLDGLDIGDGLYNAELAASFSFGSITLTTAAGQAPTLEVTGAQIEYPSASDHCHHWIQLPQPVSNLFHAQTLGLFSTDGQLQNATFTWNGDIATAEVDGVIKASDLVGGSLTATGTIIGVSDAGVIHTPSLSANSYCGRAGVITNFDESNPNGDYPSYNFTITWPMVEGNNPH